MALNEKATLVVSNLPNMTKSVEKLYDIIDRFTETDASLVSLAEKIDTQVDKRDARPFVCSMVGIRGMSEEGNKVKERCVNYVRNPPGPSGHRIKSGKYEVEPRIDNTAERDVILSIINNRHKGQSFKYIAAAIPPWVESPPHGGVWSPKVVKSIYEWYENRSLESVRRLMTDMVHPRADCWQRNLKVDAFEKLRRSAIEWLGGRENADWFLAEARRLIMYIYTYIWINHSAEK